METTPKDAEQVFYVWWGNLNLGHVDSRSHAEGIIRRHISRRQRGQRNSRSTMRREYWIEELAGADRWNIIRGATQEGR